MVKNSKTTSPRKGGGKKSPLTTKSTKKTSSKKTVKKPAAKKNVAGKTVRRKKASSHKKSLLPSIILVGGIFFLMIIVIVAIVMNLKVNKLKEQQQVIEKVKEKKKQEYIEKVNAEYLDRQIKAFLFDNNISKNNILEHSVSNYSKSFFIEYKLKIRKNRLKKLKIGLYDYLKRYGFQPEDKGNKIYLYKKKSQILIEFVYKKTTQKETVIGDKPKLSIIIDDAGNDLKTLRKLLKIKYPITIATIPYTMHDMESVAMIKRAGKTPFLHQPGEPKSYPEADPGKGAIFVNMPEKLIKETLKNNFERLNGVEGFNNHMGSALTESRVKMIQVLKYARKYTDIFVDSRTTPNTVAYDICKKTSFKCGQNKKFIDNELDHNYIKNKLDESADYAKKHGKIIIIGHLKPDTVDVLLEYLPKIEKKGIEIVNIKEVLD